MHHSSLAVNNDRKLLISGSYSWLLGSMHVKGCTFLLNAPTPAGSSRYLPASLCPRPRTPGSYPRLSPRTQAAARRWGSGSVASRSPGCPVRVPPCSSYPADLPHIHLTNSTCPPYLVPTFKTPVTDADYDSESTSRLQFRCVFFVCVCVLRYLVTKWPGCYCRALPGQDTPLPAWRFINRPVIQFPDHCKSRNPIQNTWTELNTCPLLCQCKISAHSRSWRWNYKSEAKLPDF